MYLAYITIINKKLESPRSSHTVISLTQAHFYVCGIVSDIDYESPFLHVCVSYIQHWDVRICGKIFYGMWNIHVILFVIQYIHSHFDALLNILQFTILCVWQNNSFKMIDNIFISIHVSCSNCICIGSLPSTFENSYLNLLSTHIVLVPIFISETSFIITFYYNGLYCAWQTNYLKQHFLVSWTVKINKTINM